MSENRSQDDACAPNSPSWDEIPSGLAGIALGQSRRAFLGRMGAAAAAMACFAPESRAANRPLIEADPLGPYSRRRERAYKVRTLAARGVRKAPVRSPVANTDETLYPNRIGNFTKGLPHNDAGEVDAAAYEALVRALASGKSADFAAIPMAGNMRLVSPQAAFSLSLQGDDMWSFAISAAPAFASAETAAEILECYWMALARDIPFADFATHSLIARAAADLFRTSGYTRPKAGEGVTPDLLFRIGFPGALTGPYISQFLLKKFTTGVTIHSQKERFPAAGSDFATEYPTWLALMRGNVLSPPPVLEEEASYIRTLRDLAEWVHNDYPGQCGVHAAHVLSGYGPDFASEANPYRGPGNQTGFATFGPGDVFAAIADAAGDSLRAAWFQKWLVHRRVRPEEYAGRIHLALTQGAESDLFHPDLFPSEALTETFARFGTYLLPLAYPEGCPLHPAYPSGHATFAGATITMLKAYFREDAIIPDPVAASADGSTLLPYSGPPLTIGGELNKLATNIAMGRISAGLHWRTDATEGLRLGEEVALALLRDRRVCYRELFTGFRLTRFDGTTVTA